MNDKPRITFSGKISIKVGNKNLGEIDLSKGLSDKEAKEMIWKAIMSNEPILFMEGQDTSLKLESGITIRFHVNQAFAFHGFTQDHRIYATIPITLETLKGLGIISKLKGEY